MEKLIATYEDDRWQGIAYVHDCGASRFIITWLQMYMRASRHQNYAKKREVLALAPLFGMTPRRFAATLAFPLLQYPALRVVVMMTGHIIRRVLRAKGKTTSTDRLLSASTERSFSRQVHCGFAP
jgi:hypothetical protein